MTTGHFNTNMPFYPYRNPHYKDKTVSEPSYLYNENPYAWQTVLISKQCLYLIVGYPLFQIWLYGKEWAPIRPSLLMAVHQTTMTSRLNGRHGVTKWSSCCPVSAMLWASVICGGSPTSVWGTVEVKMEGMSGTYLPIVNPNIHIGLISHHRGLEHPIS